MADALPPGVTEIGRVAGDKPGSWWVLGSDGGVFALDGASYYGSYTGLEGMGYGAQDPNRQWDRIDAIAGGYRLVDKKGSMYDFRPPPNPTPPPPAPPADNPQASTAPPTSKPETVSGEAILSSALKSYGLESLGADLLTYLRGEGQGSVDATYLKMRENPLYKKRFSGMEAREKAGYDPISEEQYVQWQGQAKSLFDHYGIPKEFYDTDEEMASFIGGDVSPSELKTRIEEGYNMVFSSDPQTLNALQSMYGVDAGHMAAFFLDPTKGEDIVKRRWTAAQIGTQALKTGFGDLTAAEGEALATSGLTGKEAQGAFGMLQQADQLTEGFTREEKLGVVGGDVAANEKLKTEATKKKSAFESGGGYATGQGGVSGLGTAGG